MALSRQNDLLKAEIHWHRRRLFGNRRRSLWRGLFAFVLWGGVTSVTLYIAFFNV